MAVTLSPDLAGLLAMTGHRWPDADEDQLVTMADGWRGLQDRLTTVRTDHNRPAQEIVAGNESLTVAAFGNTAKEFDGFLLRLVEICAQVETALIAVARAVLEVKKAIVGALEALAKVIAALKRDASEIPVVGWLVAGVVGNVLEAPVTAATRAITWILDRFSDVIVYPIIQQLIEPIRAVEGIVQALRKFGQLDFFGDWPTNPSGDVNPENTPHGVRADENEGDDEKKRGLRLQNQAADTLAQAGYDVEQLKESKVPGVKNPDYRIEGVEFEAYSPSTSNVRNIWTRVKEEKVKQADHIIININSTDAQSNVEALRQQFQDYPVPGLKELKVIAPGGAIIHIYP